MRRVIIRHASYDYTTLQPLIFNMMDSLGGNNITAASRVLIKPNLLAAAPPRSAVVTHPFVIKAVVEYLNNKGCIPTVADSPAVGSFNKILKVSGISASLDGLDVTFKELRDSVHVDVGEPFRHIEISRDVMYADTVINLPKLKTHTQMLLTLGIKNLFGCVTGMKKPEWHLRAGVDREKFATLLVKIYQAIKPSITILDGILAMEGQGPGKGGTPRKLNVVIGSDSSHAIDITVCRMLGIEPDTLMTNKIAKDFANKVQEIELDGDIPGIDGFKFPNIVPLTFGPAQIHGFIRRHLVQRPVCSDKCCKLCGECWEYCPAGAIDVKKKRIRFDYDKCIRCYCCIEVCPHGALATRESAAGKILRRLVR